MQQPQTPLKDIAKLFFKLGCIGFGGPAVHIALLDQEVVKKRQWLSQGQFLDLIGATNLIPGPNSTEMTMHVGQERAGWKGLIVAGVCFISPAVVLTMVLAWLYKKYGNLPEVEPFIYGIMPAVIAIIADFVIKLGKKAIKSMQLLLITIAAVSLAVLDVNEVYILFGAGLLGILIHLSKKQGNTLNSLLPLAAIQLGFLVTDGRNWRIFLSFLKIGAILYGTGYVLYAFMDAEFVKTGMISKRELIDAIAVGQFTPGPLFSSATFVGWQIGGFTGAVLATLGIFLPSFLFVAFINPLLPRLKKSKLFTVFLDTVNAVSVGLILAVGIGVGKSVITDWHAIFITIAGLTAALSFKNLNKAFIIFGGALLGYLLTFI